MSRIKSKEAARVFRQNMLEPSAGISDFAPFMTTENTTTRPERKDPMTLTHMDTEELSRFVTDTGKILPRRITGLNAIQQRHLTKTIKRARHLLLLK